MLKQHCILLLFILYFRICVDGQGTSNSCASSVRRLSATNKDTIYYFSSKFLVSINCTYDYAGSLEGYAVEIFFTSPVSTLKNNNNSTNAEFGMAESHKDHWIVHSSKGNYSGSSFKFYLVATCNNCNSTLGVSAIIFNGKLMHGSRDEVSVSVQHGDNGISLEAFKDCSHLMTNFIYESKGERASFDLTLPANPNEVGLAVDLLFNQPVQDIKVERFSASKKTPSHWTLINEGWRTNQGETPVVLRVVVDSCLLSEEASLRSIIANKKLLCGLVPSLERQEVHNYLVETAKSNHRLLISILFFLLLLIACGILGVVFVAMYLVKNKLLTPHKPEDPVQFQYNQTDPSCYPDQSYGYNLNEPCGYDTQGQPYPYLGQEQGREQYNYNHTPHSPDLATGQIEEYGEYVNPKR